MLGKCIPPEWKLLGVRMGGGLPPTSGPSGVGVAGGWSGDVLKGGAELGLGPLGGDPDELLRLRLSSLEPRMRLRPLGRLELLERLNWESLLKARLW